MRELLVRCKLPWAAGVGVGIGHTFNGDLPMTSDTIYATVAGAGIALAGAFWEPMLMRGKKR